MDCSPGNFPGKSTGVGCHFLLQGIILSQGSNPGLLHCRQMLYLWATREAHIVLYFGAYNRFIILFMQVIHKKPNTKKWTFFILQYSTLKNTVVQNNSWHTGTGIKRTGRKSYRLDEGEEGGDGRAEEFSAIRDGGQAAVSLPLWHSFWFLAGFNSIYPLEKKKSTETHVHIFESLQLEGLYVGNLLYLKFLPASKNKPYLPLILEDPTGLENHWKQLLKLCLWYD